MKYRSCPSCQSQNREIDTKCYNCEAELGAAPAEPETLAAPIGSTTGFSQNPDRSSNWKHGLRSGAIAGAIMGMLWGVYGALFGGALIGAYGAAGMFGLVFLSQVIFCVLVGVACGFFDALCYRYDAMRVGGLVGVVLAALQLDLLGMIRGAAYGSAMGWLCSHVEKRKRGQYSEFM